MKKFIEQLQSNKEFAKEFAEYLSGADAKVKEGTKQVGEQLNKVVMTTIMDFAKSKGMELSDDEDVKKQLSILSKQICIQLDEMITKQFKAMTLARNNG